MAILPNDELDPFRSDRIAFVIGDMNDSIAIKDAGPEKEPEAGAAGWPGNRLKNGERSGKNDPGWSDP